jgi:peptidyl-dipeptidase Dcp
VPLRTAPLIHHGWLRGEYCAYIWSEVLDANTVQWIKQHDVTTNGGREYVLGPGGQIEAGKLFQASPATRQIGPLLGPAAWWRAEPTIPRRPAPAMPAARKRPELR